MRYVGLVFLLGVAACTPGAVSSTIKTIFELGVALCEITVAEHPELVPPGQVVDQICKDATFVKPFVDEVTTSKKRSLARLRQEPAKLVPAESKPGVPPKD